MMSLETLSTERKRSKSGLLREPIHKKREKIVVENVNISKKKKKGLYPDLSDYETENESDTFEESHDETLEKNESEKSTLNICLEYLISYKYILSSILLFCLVPLLTFFSPFDGKMKTRGSVAELISEMTDHFENQHELTYRILKSELKKVVESTDEPTVPAIITLMANKGSEGTASEFSQHLAKELAPERYLLINDTKYWHGESDEIRLEIDNEIKTFAQNDSLNVIVVDKVEKIPYNAAMIFHSYCDHEAAPYKRAVFLFIVPANEIISVEADSKYIDKIAMKRLRDIWRDASNDIIDSLITRITVAVISVR